MKNIDKSKIEIWLKRGKRSVCSVLFCLFGLPHYDACVIIIFNGVTWLENLKSIFA